MCLDNTCVSLDIANYDAELESVSKSQKTSENIEKHARCSLRKKFTLCAILLCMRLSHATDYLYYITITTFIHLYIYYITPYIYYYKKNVKK